MNDEKFNQKAYNKAYLEKNYKNIAISAKKDEINEIIKFCKDMNVSRNKFLLKCAKYVIDNDLLDEIMHK